MALSAEETPVVDSDACMAGPRLEPCGREGRPSARGLAPRLVDACPCGSRLHQLFSMYLDCHLALHQPAVSGAGVT